MFVHRSTDANGVPSNGLVAVTERGLLLVDTAWTDAQTEAVLAWGDGRFHRPWLGAVITHDHNDRAGGLGALERRHIPVAALDLTVAKLAARGVHGVTTLFLARDGAFVDPRGFEVFYPGPGHAPDNIVLRFPGLVFGGCLVKSMVATDLGFTGAADLAAWPAAIKNVRARYTDPVIVPGHGRVDMTGRPTSTRWICSRPRRPHRPEEVERHRSRRAGGWPPSPVKRRRIRSSSASSNS